MSKLNGHSVHNPSREDDINYLAYVGNGYFGLAFDSKPGEAGTLLPEENLTIRIRGQRTLSVAASYKPYIEVKLGICVTSFSSISYCGISEIAYLFKNVINIQSEN